MKILLVLVFFVSFGSFAQCFERVHVISGIDPSEEKLLVLTEDTIDTCAGYWISSASEVKNQMSAEVTPEGFLQAFTFGLSLYLTFWYGPYLVSLANQLIRKL